jgi:hypothetical protein
VLVTGTDGVSLDHFQLLQTWEMVGTVEHRRAGDFVVGGAHVDGPGLYTLMRDTAHDKASAAGWAAVGPARVEYAVLDPDTQRYRSVDLAHIESGVTRVHVTVRLPVVPATGVWRRPWPPNAQ